MYERVEEMIQGYIWKDLGVKVIEAVDGEVTLHMPVKTRQTQFHGNVHGGVLATLADMSMAAAVNTLVEEKEFTVTAEIKVNYLRPAAGDFLEAKGKVIKRGRTLSHCQAEVFDDSGKQVCFVVATFYMFKKE
ncbi:PaaI family thioesterase [Pueribacillus theae]|uniref:PaaI family thioesterase n=1 Tax=Pueribacillus theae TaxID=2171751 RepID=A0A2U1JRX4_9BACI|nr:PaaI family thioesterase [Pueribacillus theae]PWA07704.1 PaaI family thioesterase [Pueribacillus theae]